MLFVIDDHPDGRDDHGTDPTFNGLKFWLMLFVIMSVCTVVLMAVERG